MKTHTKNSVLQVYLPVFVNRYGKVKSGIFSLTVFLLLSVAGCRNGNGITDSPPSQPPVSVPEIDSVNPEMGSAGTPVTITGKGFSAIPEDNAVTFNGIPSPVTSAAETQIEVTVPDIPKGTESGPVEVTVAGQTATGPVFAFLPTVVVSTWAGSNQGNSDGDSTGAQFSFPTSLLVTPDGTLFVTDQSGHRIRRITPSQEVTTVAGSDAGFMDGTGASAKFRQPYDIARDANGILYVVDALNNAIRRISTAGDVTTFAGNGTPGDVDGMGMNARFDFPHGIVMDASGMMFISDTDNHKIKKITPDGQVTTLAGGLQGFDDGPAESARFNFPVGMALSPDGNSLYVADRGNHSIRMVDVFTGEVTTIAGTGDRGFTNGPAGGATFSTPLDVALAEDGAIYVADFINHSIRIISPEGMVSTLAGTGNRGNEDGRGGQAQFSAPSGVVVNADGNLFVADQQNHRIRKIMIEYIN